MPVQKLPLFLMAADVCEPTSVYGQTCSSSIAQPEPKSGEGDMCVADSCKGSGGKKKETKKTETKKTEKKHSKEKEPPPEDPPSDESPGAPEDLPPERDTDADRIDEPPPDRGERPPLPNIPSQPGRSKYVPPPPRGKPPKPGTPERPSGGGRSIDLSWLYKIVGIHFVLNPELFSSNRQAPTTSRFSVLFSPCAEHVFTAKRLVSFDLAGCYQVAGTQNFSEATNEEGMSFVKANSGVEHGIVGRAGIGLMAGFVTLQGTVVGGMFFGGDQTRPFLGIEGGVNIHLDDKGKHYLSLGGFVIPYLSGSPVTDSMFGIAIGGH